jgi:hypothetical protein
VKCLILAGISAGIVLSLAVILVILRYVLKPVGWAIEKYWDWCSDTFESEFYSTLFALTPVIMLVVVFFALLFCFIGVK